MLLMGQRLYSRVNGAHRGDECGAGVGVSVAVLRGSDAHRRPHSLEETKIWEHHGVVMKFWKGHVSYIVTWFHC